MSFHLDLPMQDIPGDVDRSHDLADKYVSISGLKESRAQSSDDICSPLRLNCEDIESNEAEWIIQDRHENLLIL